MWTVKDILALANVGALFCVVILYLWQQGRKKNPTSGEMSPDYWEKRFIDVLELIKEQDRKQAEAMRDLTQTINSLIRTLLGRGHD